MATDGIQFHDSTTRAIMRARYERKMIIMIQYGQYTITLPYHIVPEVRLAKKIVTIFENHA